SEVVSVWFAIDVLIVDEDFMSEGTNRRRLLKAIAIVVGIALLPTGLSSSGSSTLAVKGRANAYASIAADGQFVVIAWGATTTDGVTDIYAAASTDGGRTFAAPTRAHRIAGDANLPGEQPPRIALVPRSGGRH